MKPLICEIESPLTAAQAFEFLKDRPYSFFLDSRLDPQKLGRFSFIGSDPFLVMKSRGDEITVEGRGKREEGGGRRRLCGNPFDVLGQLLDQYRMDPHPALPFAGGAVGYLSYDLGRFVERLPSDTVDDLQLPECCFGFYDAIAAFDHLENKVYIASTGLPEMAEPSRGRKAERRLAELRRLLSQEAGSHEEPPPVGIPSEPALFHCNFEHDEYLKAVEAAREYICAGDIFQVNLSQRFDAPLSIPPYDLYRCLRTLNAAPFACYLNLEGVAVVSSSPERFLRLTGDLVETRPIKGTTPRGRTPAEDAAMAQKLLDSFKDRAEHVMIVDLERNDIGRVCRYGTVRVRELMALEKYATVFHLTSTVEGRLCPEKSRLDLLKACFPGGSITGAPKVRSMEIIEELEPTRRSVYTGSIGYLSFSGDMDLNIAIRTILMTRGRAYFQVGGAIVYDSEPEAEYEETLDKGKALVQAITYISERAGAPGTAP
ncbi:MAG: aminodeoxychorismate synthase component I [Chloroflexi bacterium]|nr:aminodeoxychorismate synthase component I [Chloroflexota bacterium]